jgi:hypothetical protein
VNRPYTAIAALYVLAVVLVGAALLVMAVPQERPRFSAGALTLSSCATEPQEQR